MAVEKGLASVILTKQYSMKLNSKIMRKQTITINGS